MHAAAAAGFAALALLWTYPLVGHLSTHVPGPPGDNVSFIWNFWWMRTALSEGHDIFHTTYLFAPAGIDLTLYTHTALHAFAGATVLAAQPLITAHNVVLLGSAFLNGFCTYLLAWRTTRDGAAAFLAGIIFAGSPFIAAHMTGHFNLTTAWPIPLFALAASSAMARGSKGMAAVAGVILGATTYVDYYYVIFQLALTACFVLLEAGQWSLSLGVPPTARSRASRVVGALVLADLVLLIALAVTGGFRLDAGPLRISVNSAFNPLQLLWVLAALWLWLRYRPRISWRAEDPAQQARLAAVAATLLAVFLVTAAPIVWNGVESILSGEYVSQRYNWRSAPKGIDVATLILGHPWHGLWGSWVRGLYDSMGINTVESTAWLGIAAPLLAAFALRRFRADRRVRQWTFVGVVFGVWALGPHLMAFGTNTAMILPQTVLRFVPIVSNARMPGRAMIVVYLALAVLSAIGFAAWRQRSSRRSLLAVIPAFIVLLEMIPAPFPMTLLDQPSIYQELRNRPERGTLLELPLGIRDGYGVRGYFDDRVLYYQSIHGRPLIGGSASRLPPALLAGFDTDPLLSPLLALSAGATGVNPPDARVAADALARHGVAFVMLNEATAPPALSSYVQDVLPLDHVATEGDRTLYLVRRQPTTDQHAFR